MRVSVFLLAGMYWSSSANAAELSRADEAKFDQYIDQLCSAAVTDQWKLVVEENEEYETILDIPTAAGLQVFEDEMMCFWDQVMIERTEVLQNKFNPIFQSIGSEYEVPDYEDQNEEEEETECAEGLETILIQKRKEDVQTVNECPDQNEAGALDFCEVSQASYRELCALELWAWGKKSNGSLKSETNQLGELNQNYVVNQITTNLNRQLETERRVITQSVWDYFYWDQTMHLHLWILVTSQNLSLLDSMLNEMRKALLTWPTKMINSASYQEN